VKPLHLDCGCFAAGPHDTFHLPFFDFIIVDEVSRQMRAADVRCPIYSTTLHFLTSGGLAQVTYYSFIKSFMTRLPICPSPSMDEVHLSHISGSVPISNMVEEDVIFRSLCDHLFHMAWIAFDPPSQISLLLRLTGTLQFVCIFLRNRKTGPSQVC